jgi:hypothetical protein
MRSRPMRRRGLSIRAPSPTSRRRAQFGVRRGRARASSSASPEPRATRVAPDPRAQGIKPERGRKMRSQRVEPNLPGAVVAGGGGGGGGGFGWFRHDLPPFRFYWNGARN